MPYLIERFSFTDASLDIFMLKLSAIHDAITERVVSDMNAQSGGGLTLKATDNV